MNLEQAFAAGSGGLAVVSNDWMAATAIRPLVFNNPAQVWLQYHGARHGLTPVETPYDFLDFIGNKSRQFQDKWIRELAGQPPTVCAQNFEVRNADRLRTTLELMAAESSVIVQPALWWSPERIYGVPDLLVSLGWLRDAARMGRFRVTDQRLQQLIASPASNSAYVVLDCKFTTKLTETEKKVSLQNYAAQVRIYTYMLGKLQGWMPPCALLITRDRLVDPISVESDPNPQRPFDADLVDLRDRFLDIKLRGDQYLPWRDAAVSMDLSAADEKWGRAMTTIAVDRYPGKDPQIIYQVSRPIRDELAAHGFTSVDSMLRVPPAQVPLEACRGIGAAKSRQIRAILAANRAGVALRPPAATVPQARRFEFFVDYEYFTNLNVDFEAQWPQLEGCPMVFMIGVGLEANHRWQFKSFIAETESKAAEFAMAQEFLGFLEGVAGNALLDRAQTALYHWTSAEVWQTRHITQDHQLPPDHALGRLPWEDLQKVFLAQGVGMPSAWTFQLKDVGEALGRLDPAHAVRWPGELDEGLKAMVMGWTAYRTPVPMESVEMTALEEYLEADCAALRSVLNWLRE